MEEFCKGLFKGLFVGAVVGMCVGGIAVAKNKKLANKINSCTKQAEEKITEAKEMIEEKIEKCQMSSDSGESGQNEFDFGKNKKPKN